MLSPSLHSLSLSFCHSLGRRSLSGLHSSASLTVCPTQAVSLAPGTFSSAFSSSGVAHWYNWFQVPFKTGSNRAVCITGGVCRAKLGAQCVLRCPIEKRKRRKAVAAANAAANAAAAEAAARAAAPAAQGMLTSQVSMRESVSSASESLDDDLDISQEPTGTQSSMKCL